MKTLTIWLLAVASVVAQPKWEIIEFSGTVAELRSGYGFALEMIDLRIDVENRYFRIDPIFGKSILSKLKVGDPLTLRARVNKEFRDRYLKANKLVSSWGYRFVEQVVEIRIDEQWISTPLRENVTSVFPYSNTWSVFLEKAVVADYFVDGLRKGLIFQNGVVAFAVYSSSKYNSMKEVNLGDKVSFLGYRTPVREEYLYPIDGVSDVYSYISLKKIEGKIHSFIYKQNFVRIGLVVNQKRLSFLADYGIQVERFANDESTTIYYDGIEDEKHNILPTIHAIIQGNDTLIIPNRYYGDPDGKHEHKDTELVGKVSRVNRTDKGRIISLIMGNDCYVEVDPKMAEQLGNYLAKGKELKISGDERIKKEGEIYEKGYRIITPRKVVADGKEFILKK